MAKKVDTGVAPAETSDDSMNFDLAFGEAAEEPLAQDTAPVIEAKGEEQNPLETEEQEEQAQEPEQKEEPKAEEPKVEEPKAEAPDQFKALQDKIAELEAKLLAASAPPKEEPKPEPKAEPKKFELTEEEKKTEAELIEDWPTIKEGFDLFQRKLTFEMEQAFDAKLQATLQHLTTQLGPVMQTVAGVQEDKFITAVRAAHPDLDTIFPQVEAWVNAHPPTLKKMYDDILNTGTSEDVSALLSTFKKSSAYAQAPAQPAAPKPQDPAKTKRVEQMRGVKKETSGITSGPDKNDFYGAFERAAEG